MQIFEFLRFGAIGLAIITGSHWLYVEKHLGKADFSFAWWCWVLVVVALDMVGIAAVILGFLKLLGIKRNRE